MAGIAGTFSCSVLASGCVGSSATEQTGLLDALDVEVTGSLLPTPSRSARSVGQNECAASI